MSLADPTSLDAGFIRTDGVGPFAINDATGVVHSDPSLRAMIALMRGDVAAVKAMWPEPLVRRFYPGVFIAWCHRVAHTLHVRRLKPIAMVVMWFCHMLTGAEIRPGASIGPGLVIIHPTGVVIGGGTIIGSRVLLMGGNLFGANMGQGIHGSPKVGDDVVFGAHAVVLGPVQLGDRVTVGAASLVLDDVPDDAKVKGSPAR